MRNYVQNAINAGLSHELAIRRVMMLAILTLAGLAIIMWSINVWWVKEINYIFFFVGLLLLIGKGTKPVVWSTAILTGGAWNLAQLENPLRGGADGLVFWITKGLPAVIVFWLFLSGFLATWSFEQSPGSFFPIAGFGILIFFALTAWEKWEGDWMFNIVLYYSIGVLVIALLATLGIRPIETLQYTFFPPTSFSEETGKVQTMMHPATGTEIKSRTVKLCEAQGGCYNGDDGQRLIPFDPAASKALKQNNNRRSHTPDVLQKPAPIPRLTEADYTDMVFGKFQKREVEPGQTNRIGPVTNFSGSSLCHTKSGGMGRLVIWTRADFESEPVRATLASDGISIVSFGHAGAPWQMFYGAENGTADIVLERKNQPMTC